MKKYLAYILTLVTVVTKYTHLTFLTTYHIYYNASVWYLLAPSNKAPVYACFYGELDFTLKRFGRNKYIYSLAFLLISIISLILWHFQ